MHAQKKQALERGYPLPNQPFQLDKTDCKRLNRKGNKLEKRGLHVAHNRCLTMCRPWKFDGRRVLVGILSVRLPIFITNDSLTGQLLVFAELRESCLNVHHNDIQRHAGSYGKAGLIQSDCLLLRKIES
jgi:hypothetical protein